VRILDVNVLIALFHAGHPAHEAAIRWWRGALERGSAVTVPDLVWTGFVRLVTHPRAVTSPATLAEAWDFVAAVRANGIYLEHVPPPATLARFEELSRTSSATGNLITDAYIAASAVAAGATLVTFDRDFRRFDGLRLEELTA
jgi:toxin-antitoxin system PIN domain toxin